MIDWALPQPCISWHKYIRDDGYGLAWDPVRKVMRMAHRVIWEAVNGPLPDEVELDHRCGLRSCVELTHLEPVDHLENCRRGTSWTWRTEITHCPADHEYTPENTGHQVNRRGTTRESVVRYCRTCKVVKSRERRARLQVDARV